MVQLAGVRGFAGQGGSSTTDSVKAEFTFTCSLNRPSQAAAEPGRTGHRGS